MDANGKLKRQAEDGPIEDFLWASQNAIARYADWRFAAIVRSVRRTLEREKPSGIFDLPRLINQWREYCYQVNFGPDELEVAFDHLVDPLIDFRLERLPQEEAILLSVAREWETDALEHQDGRTISLDLLKRGARLALRQLAMNTDCDSWDG